MHIGNKEIEIDVESTDVFIKFDPVESIEIKKELLEMSANSISSMIISERYKALREKEIKTRTFMKKTLNEIENMTGSLIEILPKGKKDKMPVEEKEMEEFEKEKEKVEKEAVKETKAKKVVEKIKQKEVRKVPMTKEESLEQQLLDIKRKLSGL